MSLIYGRQRENRTDYLEDFSGRELGKPPLDAFIGVTVFGNGAAWPAGGVRLREAVGG